MNHRKKNSEISGSGSRISEVIFDIDGREQHAQKLQAKTTAPDFWSDNVQAQKVMQEINQEKVWIDEWYKSKRLADDVQTLIELAEESQDESMTGELEQELQRVEKGITEL
ncbi:MAG: PCRF domain-containing protein, partial [Bacteroidota bacterium]